MILDTNALSALADGSTAFEAAAAGVSRFAIPAIVLGEFHFGILRSRQRARYEEWLTELVGVSRVLSVDEQTAVHYAELSEQLRRRGRPIPSNDAWIAALGLQYALAVFSRDAHFDEVAKLVRISW